MKYRNKRNPQHIIKAAQYVGIEDEFWMEYPNWVKRAIENGELSHEKDGLRCRCTNQKIKVGGYITKDEVALVRSMEEFEENYEPVNKVKRYIQEIKGLRKKVRELNQIIYTNEKSFEQFSQECSTYNKRIEEFIKCEEELSQKVIKLSEENKELAAENASAKKLINFIIKC